MNRRCFLLTGGALVALPSLAEATPDDVTRVLRAAIGNCVPQKGRVKLDIPVMVENGNAVAMSVSVADPPSPVEAIHVFAEGNPLPRVAVFRFGPRSGAPRVATRMRLATSQTVIAIAKLRDGTCWRDSVDLLVTLAACIE